MKRISLMCIVLLLLVFACSVDEFVDRDVVIPDEALRALILGQLEVEDGVVMKSDMATLTQLDARGQGIKDLTGLEHARNLLYLDLRDNDIQDISALARLSELRTLDLRNNQVSDIGSLAGLDKLLELDLRGNEVKDISPIGQLVWLTQLNLRDNLIEDITPLADLLRLESLNIRGNQIRDLSALRKLMFLQDLNCRHNHITDISPLVELPMLTKRLYLEGNPITDFFPLLSIYDQVDDLDLWVNVGFTVPGGFYDGEIYVEMFTFNHGGKIYFTLDGSEPHPDNSSSKLYTGPISLKDRSSEPNYLSTYQTTFHGWNGPPKGPISKGNVVRAQVFEDGEPVGNIATQTYFVGSMHYTLPVVSLVTPAQGLFSDETGIYVPGNHHRTGNLWTGNYAQRGELWERPTHIEFFKDTGDLGFSQDIGIRIHGGITRSWPQKSLRLYSRSGYGESRFRYQIFPDLDQDNFNRLILRNSGNDKRLTMFRDAMAQSLLVGTTDLDIQAYRPVIVYINGEYWGIHNIRERQDRFYISEKYDIDADDVVILYIDGYLSEGQSGDQQHYREMVNFVRRNNMANPDNYARVSTMMDIDNYIDYQIAQIYFSNTDWPHNNIAYWRHRVDEFDPDAPYGKDGRWRWLVYDTDYGFGLAEPPSHNTLEWATNPETWATDLFRGLLDNPDFKQKFIMRFADHLNSTFAPARVVQVIDEMQAVLAPEMEEHINRWPYIRSMAAWERNVDVMRNFAKRRPEHVFGHLNQMFSLGGHRGLEIDVEGQGEVIVNSIQAHLPFHGRYFQRFPVTVTAVAAPGFEFVGWEGSISSSEETLELTMTKSFKLRAVFKAE